MTRLMKCCAAFLLFASSCASAIAEQDAKSSLNPLEMQKARAKSVTSKGDKVWYTDKFDLSGLPEYKPETQVAGTIRQWGNNYLADSPLSKMWEDAFRKYQPGVEFKDNLTSSAVGFPGLITGAADIGQMGRAVLWDELQGYQRQFASEPIELTIATGSYNVPGWTFALGVFVHKDNPISKLTFEQLDGIFGAQRTGGWKGLTWDPAVARGADKNIRTWGQLGLTGEWADKPIHVYGYTAQFHFPDEFSKKVMSGSSKWNETIKEYVNAARPDGTLAIAGDLFMPDLAKDPYGIAYTGIPHSVPGTKSLALAAKEGGAYVALTLETVQNRSYPLARDVYAYIHSEKPLDSKIKEFMRFVLSREGQELVMKDGKYLPLTAEAVRDQLSKLQ
jgi:phosphate transport system substrate-binding protein